MQTEVKGLKRSLETAKGDGAVRVGPAATGRTRTNFKPLLRGGEEGSDDASVLASMANPMATVGGSAAATSSALAGFANKGVKLSAIAKRRNNRASIVESKAAAASADDDGDGDGDPEAKGASASPRAAAAAAAASSAE